MSARVARAEISSDERVAAALAHALIIVQTVGIIGAAMIWLLQKDKSPYVARHALQAVAYQFVGLLLWFGALFFYMIVIFGGMGFLAMLRPREPSGVAFPLFFSLPMCLIFLIWGLLILYGLYGAYVALQGRDFRYVIIGPLVERALGSTR